MNLVRELRKALQLTQTELGNRLGYSLPTIQRWESFEIAPRGEPLLNLEQLSMQAGQVSLAESFRAQFRKQFRVPERTGYCEIEEDTLP